MRSLMLLIMFAATAAAAEPQFCDLAPEYRQSNWGKPGSCGYASNCSAMRWIQLFSDAAYWRGHYSHALNLVHNEELLKAAGIHYVSTADGDERVLDYGIQSRRGAIIYWGPHGNHITYLIGRENGNAVILDNNHVNKLTILPYGEWRKSWRAQGGCAIVLLDGQVPPPVPE